MEKKKVFVIMPFTDEFFEVYEMLKMNFSEKFEFSNAGDEANQQNILKDIIQPIYEADIIIADLTGLNANVMYELGLAHTFNKKTIIITQDDISNLPFDLKQYRVKDYNTHFKKFDELIDYLERNLNGALDGSVSYSNPVKDFLDSEGVKNISWFEQKELVVLENNTDKGFLDFLADIETNTEELSDDIGNMASDMNEMTTGVNGCVSEIERVKQTGGKGTAAFVRKQSKKAAMYIGNFSEKLRGHNDTIAKLWDRIEKDTLGLLENTYASQDKNKNDLIGYLTSLYNLKITINEHLEPIIVLKDTMNNMLGMERSMNQAVRFINEDLATYQGLMERMCTSIDKVIEKSKFVVGTIDFDAQINASNN